MTNFQSRLLIGTIYVGATVGMIIWNQLTAWTFLGLIQLACLFEFYRLTTTLSSLVKWISLFTGSVVFGMVIANQDSTVNIGALVYMIIPLILLNLVVLLTTPQHYFLKNTLAVLAGWIYVSLPFGFLARIGNLIFDPSNTDLLPYYSLQILVIFILIWLSDTFAYLAGRAFGKHPLWKSVSPKKTIEGFLGGMVATVAVAWFLVPNWVELSAMEAAILAVIVVVTGTLGDLFESQIKRSLGIKDSGTALGGHGGFLDRFDSILFAAPACYVYLRFLAVM